VLVTGGTSGIGQAIAVRLAEYGANVAINYLRQAEEAHDTREQVHACVSRVKREGVRDALVQGDVSKEDDVAKIVGSAVDQLGTAPPRARGARSSRSRYTTGCAAARPTPPTTEPADCPMTTVDQEPSQLV
jgi:NAD(P)-dependent dehydrogenase (short-subunit alcohol dehydrogenase family)